MDSIKNLNAFHNYSLGILCGIYGDSIMILSAFCDDSEGFYKDSLEILHGDSIRSLSRFYENFLVIPKGFCKESIGSL